MAALANSPLALALQRALHTCSIRTAIFSPATSSGMNPRLGCLAQESLALRNSLLEKLVAMGTAQVGFRV